MGLQAAVLQTRRWPGFGCTGAADRPGGAERLKSSSPTP